MCFVPDHAGTYFALVISKKLDAGLINGWHPNWQVQIQMIDPVASTAKDSITGSIWDPSLERNVEGSLLDIADKSVKSMFRGGALGLHTFWLMEIEDVWS